MKENNYILLVSVVVKSYKWQASGPGQSFRYVWLSYRKVILCCSHRGPFTLLWYILNQPSIVRLLFTGGKKSLYPFDKMLALIYRPFSLSINTLRKCLSPFSVLICIYTVFLFLLSDQVGIWTDISVTQPDFVYCRAAVRLVFLAYECALSC